MKTAMDHSPEIPGFSRLSTVSLWMKPRRIEIASGRQGDIPVVPADSSARTLEWAHIEPIGGGEIPMRGFNHRILRFLYRGAWPELQDHTTRYKYAPWQV